MERGFRKFANWIKPFQYRKLWKLPRFGAYFGNAYGIAGNDLLYASSVGHELCNSTAAVLCYYYSTIGYEWKLPARPSRFAVSDRAKHVCYDF